jgi:hypothetical protein
MKSSYEGAILALAALAGVTMVIADAADGSWTWTGVGSLGALLLGIVLARVAAVVLGRRGPPDRDDANRPSRS